MKIEYKLPQKCDRTPRAFKLQPPVEGRGRAPRIARLLALAHKLEKLVQSGEVKDHAELARIGHVSPARLSQIVILAQLAPVIQEHILFLSPEQGELFPERELRKIAREMRWDRQRAAFQRHVQSLRAGQSS